MMNDMKYFAFPVSNKNGWICKEVRVRNGCCFWQCIALQQIMLGKVLKRLQQPSHTCTNQIDLDISTTKVDQGGGIKNHHIQSQHKTPLESKSKIYICQVAGKPEMAAGLYSRVNNGTSNKENVVRSL